MSVSAVLALRRAVRARLAADADLMRRVSGVFDEAPASAAHPYVAFGDSQTRDWSADASPGAEQFLVLHVWSRHRGLVEALDIAHCIARLLDEAPLAVEGHHLVDLRFLSLETRRNAAGASSRASLRFRATLEILE